MLRHGLCTRHGEPDTRGGTKDLPSTDCSPPSAPTASSVLPVATARRERLPVRECGALCDAASELNLLRGREAEGAKALTEAEIERTAAAAHAPKCTIIASANPEACCDLIWRVSRRPPASTGREGCVPKLALDQRGEEDWTLTRGTRSKSSSPTKSAWGVKQPTKRLALAAAL